MGQRRRRWPIAHSTLVQHLNSTLGEHLMFAGMEDPSGFVFGINPIPSHMCCYWANQKTPQKIVDRLLDKSTGCNHIKSSNIAPR